MQMPVHHLCISELMGQPDKNVWEKAANVLPTRKYPYPFLRSVFFWFEPPIPLFTTFGFSDPLSLGIFNHPLGVGMDIIWNNTMLEGH